MNLTYLAGILLGMVAALQLNVGKGVQKQKVHVLLQGRQMLSRPHRRDFGIWMVGMALTGTAAIPFSLGLKFSESPSAISAMTGVGLVGLTFYAVKVIGERASRVDGIGIALVVAATSLLGYLGGSRATLARAFDDRSMLLSLLVLAGLALFGGLAGWCVRRIHGVAFGLAAGVFLGASLVLADAALIRSNGDFLGQLRNPYPYAAMGVGFLALVATQLGFLRGRALEVVPAFNSATIVTPLILEAVIYGTVPPATQMMIVGVIVVGVVLLSLGAAGAVSVGPAEVRPDEQARAAS